MIELMISLYGELLATLSLAVFAMPLFKKTEKWTFVRCVALKTNGFVGRDFEGFA